MITKEEKLNKGAAFVFFLKKYAPVADKDDFELVAKALLREKGYPDTDLENLTSEQENLLVDIFKKLSENEICELADGILMQEYSKEGTKELRQRTETVKAARQKRREKKKEVVLMIMNLGGSYTGAEATYRLLRNKWKIEDDEMINRLEGMSLDDIFLEIWDGYQNELRIISEKWEEQKKKKG